MPQFIERVTMTYSTTNWERWPSLRETLPTVKIVWETYPEKMAKALQFTSKSNEYSMGKRMVKPV